MRSNVLSMSGRAGRTPRAFSTFIYVLATLAFCWAASAQAQESLHFLDEDGRPTTEIVELAPLSLQLLSPSRNLDPQRREQVDLDLSTAIAGDFELLSLQETAPDSGVFELEIQHLLAATATELGRLETAPRSTLADPVDTIIATAAGLQATAVPIGARVTWRSVFGATVEELAAGEPVVVQVLCPAADGPSALDSVSLDIIASGGDQESLTLEEVPGLGGVFSGRIEGGAEFADPGDGRLRAEVGDSYQVSFSSPANAGTVSASAGVVRSTLHLVDAHGRALTAVPESSTIHVRVYDASANADVFSRETVQVGFTSAVTGDSQNVTLEESGRNRGLFAGRIPLELGPAVGFNGRLETGQLAGPPHAFDTLTATYSGGPTGAVASLSTLGSRTEFLDPYGRPAEVLIEAWPNPVQVEDHNLDLAGQGDTAAVLISVDDDQETLALAEVRDGSGLFRGEIVALRGAPASPGNGTLESFGGEPVAEHQDSLGLSASSAIANIQSGRIDTLDAWGRPSPFLPLAGSIEVAVVSGNANSDPALVNSIEITAGSDFLYLDETGPDTGVFAADFAPVGAQLGDRFTLFGPESETAVGVVPAQIAFLDLLDRPVEAYALEATIRLGAFAPSFNVDPALAETVLVSLQNPSIELTRIVTLTETEVDSGLFVADRESFVDFQPMGGGYLVIGAGETATAIFDPYFTATGRAEVTFLDHHSPAADDDFANTDEGVAIGIEVLANDSDPEGSALEVLAAVGAAHGTLTAQPDGTVTYTPDPGFFGSDSFDYVVSDGEGGQARATVWVDVFESLELPVAADDFFSLSEDQPTVLDVLANDSVSGTPTLSVVTSPAHGALEPGPGSTFLYRPDENFFGGDSFVYRVSNESGPAEATVSLSVTSVNDPPSAGFVSYPSTSGEAPLLVHFLATHYSFDIDDGIESFTWEFGDGTGASGGGASHTYLTPGLYTVVLTVTDFVGASATATTEVEVTAPLRRALLVVLDAAQLGPGDAAVRDRLEARGFEVTIRSQGEAQASDAEGPEPKDVVLISSTVTSSQVNTKFRDVAVPVMVWEPFLLDDMGMTGVVAHVDYGSRVDQTAVQVVAPGHPLAAGLEDAVTVLSTPDRLTFGRPAAGAEIATTVEGSVSQAVIFGYHEGETMVGLTAPARRLGFFLTDQSASTLTAEGWQLFDAGLCWAVNCTRAPIARIDAQPLQGTIPLVVDFDATGTQEDLYPLATFEWDFGDGATAMGAVAQHIYETAGTYRATLTATDEAGLSSQTKVTIVASDPALPSALLVADTPSLSLADEAVRARLLSLGFDVEVMAAAAVSTIDADGRALVVVSSTVISGQVNSKFRDVAVPVITWEAWLYDDLGLTPGGTNVGYGRIEDVDSLAITTPTHPLAAGLSGIVPIVPSLGPLRWGAPVASAEVVATVDGDPGKTLVFGVETGAQLLGLTAPARRVGLPFYDDSPAVLTAEGWALFDAAVAWATEP